MIYELFIFPLGLIFGVIAQKMKIENWIEMNSTAVQVREAGL